MGIYRLIRTYDDKKPMIEFVEDELGSLIEYDEKNNTQLVQTLHAYLENDCNMVKTAQYLFAHKNTVKYRLSRIEEISGKQLDSSFNLMELYMALVIYDYLDY